MISTTAEMAVLQIELARARTPLAESEVSSSLENFLCEVNVLQAQSSVNDHIPNVLEVNLLMIAHSLLEQRVKQRK